MKTVTPAMAAFLKSESTTLTTCWKITRTDNKKFYYTELDEDITFQGDVYKSASGFNKSAMKSSAAFNTDEMEITGLLRDDAISDIEMRNGAFDYAKVEIFMVNYEDESMGKIKLRSGRFGEVATTSSGAFLVELRGLVDMLQQKIGDTYLPECRVDVGSSQCGIDVTPRTHRKGERYKQGARVLFPVDAIDNDPPRYYDEMLEANLENWYFPHLLQKDDLNVTSRSGNSQFVTVGTGSTARTRFFPSALGLSPADIASGLYQLTFTGFYYIYWENSAGWVNISNQKNGPAGYVTMTGPNNTRSIDLPNEVPERRWRPFSVTVPINPEAGRYEVIVGCQNSDNGVTRRMTYDDMQIIVSRIDQPGNPGFEKFGGREFEAQNSGRTSRGANVIFNRPLGSLTEDGGVTWKAVKPRYKFLGTVSEQTNSTTAIIGDLFNLPDGWLDWGILTFLTGKNAGRSVEILRYENDTGRVKTALPLPYQAEVGDLFSVTVGCDKRLSTCKDKFDNVINFRGHPWVPGQGAYFKVAGM